MNIESVDNEMIARLCSGLSGRGRELLEELEDAPETEAAINEVLERIQREAPADWQPILRIMSLRAQAHRARMEEHRQALEQAELARGVLYRARELLRIEGTEPREGMILQEAIEVLRRHGESPPRELAPYTLLEVPNAR